MCKVDFELQVEPERGDDSEGKRGDLSRQDLENGEFNKKDMDNLLISTYPQTRKVGFDNVHATNASSLSCVDCHGCNGGGDGILKNNDP
jgi:hypothetical protein